MNRRVLLSLLLVICSCASSTKKNKSASLLTAADRYDQVADSMFYANSAPALRERRNDTIYYVEGRYRNDTICFYTQYLGRIHCSAYKGDLDFLQVRSLFANVMCPHGKNALWVFKEGTPLGVFNHLDDVHFTVNKDAVLFTADSFHMLTTSICFGDSIPSSIFVYSWLDSTGGRWGDLYSFDRE